MREEEQPNPSAPQRKYDRIVYAIVLLFEGSYVNLYGAHVRRTQQFFESTMKRTMVCFDRRLLPGPMELTPNGINYLIEEVAALE